MLIANKEHEFNSCNKYMRMAKAKKRNTEMMNATY